MAVIETVVVRYDLTQLIDAQFGKISIKFYSLR